MSVETDLLDKLQLKRTPFLDRAMPVISNSVVVYPLADLLLLWNRKTRREGVAMAGALIFSSVEANFVLKNIFKRTRPFVEKSHVWILKKMPGDFSFPSAHTSVAFAGASSLYYAGSRKLSIPLYMLAALIAFSREYLYVHYPTDIAGGVAFGQFSGWLGKKMVDAFGKN